MKWLSFLIIAVLLHDLLIPHLPSENPSPEFESGISALDFCHAPLSTAASDDETPGTFEPSGSLMPVLSFDFLLFAGHQFMQSLPPSETDQPPKR